MSLSCTVDEILSLVFLNKIGPRTEPCGTLNSRRVVTAELEVLATICEVRLQPAKRRARHTELIAFADPPEQNAVSN